MARQPATATLAKRAHPRWPGAVALVVILLARAALAEPPGPAPAITRPPACQLEGDADGDIQPIDLPTALQLAEGSNPLIALARARVAEAYAHQREAEVAWLPDLRGGVTYLRHDGEIQNALGLVFPTSKSSLFVGGGASFSWDLSSVYYGRLVARRLTDATAAAAQATDANVQLDVALAYLDLVREHAALAINRDTLGRAEEMLQAARAGDKAGLGKTPADITRAQAEVQVRRSERFDIFGQEAVASARLARLLHLQPTVRLEPGEPSVVPISLVPMDSPVQELVQTGLQNRPELREDRSLLSAAEVRLRQARVAPFVPRLDAGYAAGLFGGGTQSDMSHFDSRGDGTVQATWELHNLGAGDVARTRARRAQVDQAAYALADTQARVGAEVVAAARYARYRYQALPSSQAAIRQALETWRRLQKASFGMAGAKREYDPLEPLLAEQALDQARKNYLNEVIEYNRAQFRLYWAMGQPPLCALPEARPVPVEVPVVPKEYAKPDILPPPKVAPE
ncbi:hypothetical protein AYO44_10720 [Planctomycetaceae bacterium SCGC AG-212-F19]|nr:hypothetical protein AYO44_10720 [Planctomycetaceae bacterium SCGC AG-212-F19]